ncbi:MAG: MFS transporter [Candidatus Velthaea sp.]
MKAATGSAPAEPRVPDRRPSVLGTLRYRDFRLLWTGLLVGNLGTWMQFTALGYEVVHIAPSESLAALYVGLIGASRAIPVLLLSPFAGVVADRYPRRRVLLATNIATALFALALALIIASGNSSLGLLMLLSGLQAATQSFDAPARQSWVPLMVPREYVASAIGFNSFAFNAPSVVGPPVAGLVIAAGGVAACMYANAVLTLAVVIALIFMKPVAASSTRRDGLFAAISEGVRYLYDHPVLRWIVLLLVATSLLVRPYNFLLPAYAAHVVHTDARGLGLLMAASGLGALGGAIVTAAIMPRRRSVLWAASALVLSIGVAMLGLTANMTVALMDLTLIGLATLTFLGSSNILMQTLSPDDMRGRSISVYSMIVLGFVPAGSLLLGSIASIAGLRATLLWGGVLAILCTLWVYAVHPRLRAI